MESPFITGGLLIFRIQEQRRTAESATSAKAVSLSMEGSSVQSLRFIASFAVRFSTGR